jgi:Tfp pilus assembly protein PilP
MNRQKVIIAGSMIGLLLLLNARQWLGNDSQVTAGEGAAPVMEFAEQDFHLSTRAGLAPAPEIAAIKRDLFFAGAARVPATVTAAKPVNVASERKAQDEKKAAQAAEAALDSFRLVGIVYNQGRYQAFIVRDDKTYTGDDGKLLEGRYLIESVDESTFTLIDTETGLKKRVELAGEEVP